MKLCWLDIRATDTDIRAAVVEEAVHQRIDGIVAADPGDLAGLPPTITRVLMPRSGQEQVPSGAADVVIVPFGRGPAGHLAPAGECPQVGRLVEVIDAATLEDACAAAREDPWSVLRFRDPTKIPLEIVIAAAAGAAGQIITVAADPQEAAVIFGVLEHGPAGVMMAPRRVGDATALKLAAAPQGGQVELSELEVVAVSHVGMGERACVDTCSYLRRDEGILVGSHSKGMILCVSETHPLPYMPTRPFRVNAGAIHSYTLAEYGRTHYLSELRAGSKVLAVDVTGAARVVTVGRVKIESRPLICVQAIAASGQDVNLFLQDDWHVRVFASDGAVLHCTELKPGDTLLGHLPTADRHVGYAIDEFCLEV
ncbi:MAG TPA: 3-dehydroquinate synthase II family protein [Streptosporangiaceae bacterium]